MNNYEELKELETWLNKIIKSNEDMYKFAFEHNDKKNCASCVSRGLAYDRVLHKIHAIQRAQKRGEI